MTGLNQSIAAAAAVLILAAMHVEKSPHPRHSGVSEPVMIENSRRKVSAPAIGRPARERTAPAINGTAQRRKMPNGSTVRLGDPKPL
jgi:hypothetical protein